MLFDNPVLGSYVGDNCGASIKAERGGQWSRLNSILTKSRRSSSTVMTNWDLKTRARSLASPQLNDRTHRGRVTAPRCWTLRRPLRTGWRATGPLWFVMHFYVHSLYSSCIPTCSSYRHSIYWFDSYEIDLLFAFSGRRVSFDKETHKENPGGTRTLAMMEQVL